MVKVLSYVPLLSLKLISALPQPQADYDAQDNIADDEFLPSQSLTEIQDSYDDANDNIYDNDDFYEYSQINKWDKVMQPVRNVGQTISKGVNKVANMFVDGNYDYYEENDDDNDYYAYDDVDKQVNAWWDAHIDADYDDYGDLEDYIGDNDEAGDSKGAEDNINDNDNDTEEYYDEYEDEDYDDYYISDLLNSIKYPKPDNSKVDTNKIHHPKNDVVKMKGMIPRKDIGYNSSDYIDFAIIAICVILLFGMMAGGVSKFNDQAYLRRTYGKRKDQSGEKKPLIE